MVGIADGHINGERFGYIVMDLLNEEYAIAKTTAIVIAMANHHSAHTVARRLKSEGYRSLWLYLNKTKTFYEDFLEGECIELTDVDALTLPSIEYQTADFCNLNCRGCSHFSPLFERIFPDYDKRILDLQLLRKLFQRIPFISILGGEPLLSPDIGKYIEETRGLFTEAEIQIVTNGLLLQRGGINDEVLKLMAKNRITVSVSEYEPTHKVIEKIKDRLEEYRIDYIIRPYDKKSKFNIAISTRSDSRYGHKCRENGCVAVCEGKIAKCPTLLYMYKFNEYFNQNMPQEGILNLSDYTDGQDLLHDLQKEVPLCKHCIDCEIDWSICPNDVTIEDFAAVD